MIRNDSFSNSSRRFSQLRRKGINFSGQVFLSFAACRSSPSGVTIRFAAGRPSAVAALSFLSQQTVHARILDRY